MTGPLTEQERRQLIELGHDPKKATISNLDKGNLIPNRTLEDVGVTALNATAPAAIGIATGAGVSAVASPLVGIPAGIIAGLLSSYGQTKALQQTESGNAFLNRVNSARVTSPTATFAAEFLPELAFMRPGKATLQAGKGIKNLLSRNKLHPLEKQALGNSLLGAGVSGGVEGALQVASGEEFDLGRVAMATGAGGLLTDPTRLGKKIGLNAVKPTNRIKEQEQVRTEIPLEDLNPVSDNVNVSDVIKSGAVDDLIDTPPTNKITELNDVVDDVSSKGRKVIDIVDDAQAELVTDDIPDARVDLIDDVELGAKLETVRDRKLENLTEDEFWNYKKSKDAELDKLEAEFDERQLSIKEKKHLAKVQVEWESAELEKFRRDFENRHIDDIRHEFRDLLRHVDTSGFENEWNAKTRVMLGILKSRGIPLVDVFGSQAMGSLTDDGAEILEGSLKKLKYFIDEPTNPTTTDSTGVPNNNTLAEPALPNKVITDAGELVDQIPTEGGSVIQKNSQQLVDNAKNITPELNDSVAIKSGTTTRENASIANQDLEGIRNYLNNPHTLEGIEAGLADKKINRDSPVEDLMDVALSSYENGNKTYDEWVASLGVEADEIEERIPLELLYKNAKGASGTIVDMPRQEFNFGPGALFGKTVERLGNFLSPTVDKIRRIQGIGPYLAPRVTRVFEEEREILGKYLHPFMENVREMQGIIPGSPQRRLANRKILEVSKVLSDEYDLGVGKSKISLDAEQLELYKRARQLFKDIRQLQNDEGLAIVELVKNKKGQIIPRGRFGKTTDNWVPQSIKEEILQQIVGEKNDKFVLRQTQFKNYRRNKLKAKFPDYDDKRIDKMVDAQWDDYVSGFNSLDEAAKASNFGPLDKPEGLGIPPEWRDLDLVRNITKYTRRAAKRISYWKHLESDPVTRVTLGLPGAMWKKNPLAGQPGQRDYLLVKAKDIKRQGANIPTGQGTIFPNRALRGNQAIADILRDIEGKNSRNISWFEGALSVVKGSRMGIGTGIRDLATMPIIASSVLTPGTVARLGMKGAAAIVKNPAKAYRDAMNGIAKHIADGHRKGVITYNIGTMENYELGAGSVPEMLFKARDFLNTVGGRSFFERVSRGANFGLGKIAAQDMILQYNKSLRNRGPKNQSKLQTEKFFDDFSPNRDWRKAYSKGNIPLEDLEHIAARLVDRVQGTYDQRGLPSFTLDPGLSPVLSLMRWGVERSINAKKHIINPMKDGNYMPALMSFASSAGLGGLLISINEMITGKKAQVASYEELFDAYQDSEAEDKFVADDLLYRVMAQLSVASHFGVAMDMMEGVINSTGNKRVDSTFQDLLIEAKDDVAQHLIAMASNSIDGTYKDRPEGFLADVDHLLLTMNQTYRIMTQFTPGHKKKIKESRDKRDLMAFENLYDYSQSNPQITGLPLRDYLKESFTKEPDIRKAAEALPPLIARAKKRARGNPEKLGKELKSIRAGTSVPFPNFETEPQKAARFLKFLQETQGEEVGRDRLREFLIDKEKVSLKNSLVPTL